MNKTQMNLQDNFLNQARKDSVPVTIYLISGVQLKGIVRGFDSFTLFLETPGKPSQLVYKHAIASVVPFRPVNTMAQREERPEQSEQSEHPVQPEQPEQPQEQPEQSEPPEQPEQPEEQPEQSEQPEQLEQPEEQPEPKPEE